MRAHAIRDQGGTQFESIDRYVKICSRCTISDAGRLCTGVGQLREHWGIVSDASGAVVGGAKVTARQLETNLTATEKTDREGRFRFPYLKVGQYEIKVQHAGFADQTRSLTVQH